MDLAIRLDDFIIKHSSSKFDWERFNCCLFGLAWVEELTGENLRSRLPDLEGLRNLKRALAKVHDLDEYLVGTLALEKLATPMARMGDVVIIPGSVVGYSFGVCTGRLSAFLADPGGIQMIPTAEIVRAWRIPEKRIK